MKVLHYLPDSLERIFMLTNGHAYYASILCKELIGILNKEEKVCSLSFGY